jgi:hypothetical protein
MEASHGWYGAFSLSHEFRSAIALHGTTPVPLDVEARIAYADAANNSYYYASDRSGFADLFLSAAFPISSGSNVAYIPSLNFATLLSNSLLAGQPERTNFWLGLTLRYKF